MDDLAQYSPRRRPATHGDLAPPFPTPIQFTLPPPVPLPERPRADQAWRPRLGLR